MLIIELLNLIKNQLIIESEDIKNRRKINAKNNSKIPHNYNRKKFTLSIHNCMDNSYFTYNIYSVNYKTSLISSKSFKNNIKNKQNQKYLSRTTIFHPSTNAIVNIFNNRKIKSARVNRLNM